MNFSASIDLFWLRGVIMLRSPVATGADIQATMLLLLVIFCQVQPPISQKNIRSFNRYGRFAAVNF
jgi:hypothetical protein